MTDKILINGYIVLHPHELEQNIDNKIIEKINKKYIICNREYGCIMKLDKVHHKYKTSIDRNTGNIKIDVKFTVTRILPQYGKELVCNVHMIFNHGIFAQIGDHIKILVPVDSIKNGKFIQTDGVFEIHDSNDAQPITIARGDVIKIKINEIKYSKNRYNCIGELIV